MNTESSGTPPEMKTVVLDMPVSMHEQLQLRARLSGAGTVPEYLRRSEAVYSFLVEKALDNGILAPDTIAGIILVTTHENIKLPTVLPFAGS
jgi:hypothetical protein